ncbi:MAG TPA: quercetin 2,3-dioxygenase, partial [Gemmata sp.]|nr:quercetin 2,3-dioxygenase [Gemmata sp.]
GQTVTHELKPGRAAFVHIATGSATVNDEKLVAGDAVAVEDESRVTIGGDEPVEVLLFDLA